jgi:hypothetical protein
MWRGPAAVCSWARANPTAHHNAMLAMKNLIHQLMISS